MNLIKKKSSSSSVINIAIMFYSALVLLLFLFFIDPSLKGESKWSWGADTVTYMNLAKGTSSDDLDLIGLSGQTVGPVLISRLLGNNTLLIAMFNYVLFLISCFVLSSTENIKKEKVVFFLTLSPMLLISILTLNKEILGILDISLTFFFISTKLTRYRLILILTIAVLARWQMAVFVSTSVLMCHIVPRTKQARWKSIIILLVITSLLYPLISKIIDLDTALSIEHFKDQAESASGFIYFLNDLQDKYMLFLSVVPKSLMNLTANPSKLLTVDHSILWSSREQFIDFYNDYIIHLQGIVTIGVVLIALKVSGISIVRNSQYLIVIYCIIFSLSPFIQTRYFFPIYPLLCLEASMKKQV